jgi:hypothetical protein
MSEAQAATPEQEARMAMNQAIQQAQKQAYEDVQKNAQIELQMRNNALGMAVNANAQGTDPTTITKTAVVFLEFLKKGEVTNG